jgi:hypothetical protein
VAADSQHTAAFAVVSAAGAALAAAAAADIDLTDDTLAFASRVLGGGDDLPDHLVAEDALIGIAAAAQR